MTAKIQSIADKAASMLRDHILEAGDELLEAWDTVAEDCDGTEDKPVLRVGYSIKLDLAHHSITTALSFGVRRKYEAAAEIPDPNQTELQIEQN
jgi:hypothetical protein